MGYPYLVVCLFFPAPTINHDIPLRNPDVPFTFHIKTLHQPTPLNRDYNRDLNGGGFMNHGSTLPRASYPAYLVLYIEDMGPEASESPSALLQSPIP